MRSLFLLTFSLLFSSITYSYEDKDIEKIIKPFMAENEIPGMAIGILYKSKARELYYGFQSKEKEQPIGKNTIFEIGSVSKIFAATTGAYAKNKSNFSFQDKPSKYFPLLKNSDFDNVSLLQLATYTSGNLDLQLPEKIEDEQQLFMFLKDWKQQRTPGKYRHYSNPSIGLFGEAAARSMNTNYDDLLKNNILKKLKMNNTYIEVPDRRMKDYATGYDINNNRVTKIKTGVLGAESYGIKSTLPDLLNLINLNLNPQNAHPDFKKAIVDTHTGYYSIGNMTQALGWEKIGYPSSLEKLLESNSDEIVLQSNMIDKEIINSQSYLFNKTGSTSGFGTYVLFIPDEKFGLVMMMNKRIPNIERIKVAYNIFKTVEKSKN